MKTKFYWLALLASAAMIAQAKAGGHHGGGGGGFSGGFAPAGRPSGSSFHPAPMGNSGGSRMMYSGQRFAPAQFQRAVSPLGSAHRPIVSNGNTSIGNRQFAARTVNRGDRFNQLANGRNQTMANQRTAGANQIRHGNNLPNNWRNHVAAQHSGNWHRDWDRHHDHVWNGHHCRFINGSWVIFDYGFYPWWPYGYPYDDYGYGYYPYAYGYDPYSYQYDPGYGNDSEEVYQGEQVYGDNGHNSSAGYVDSTVVAVQRQLAQQGFYRGQIDGVLGPETSRAIARYQSNHGLRVTGNLTRDTIAALGLRRVAVN